MAPVVAQIALENRNTFTVAKLNIKNARQTLRNPKYTIRGTPTYMVFQDGKKGGPSLVGVKSKAQLLQAILSVIDVE